MARAGFALWTMLGATLLIASCTEETTGGDGGGGSGNTTSSGTGGNTTSSGTGGDTTSSGTGGDTTSSGTGGSTSSGTGGSSSGTGGSTGGTGGSGGSLPPGCGNNLVEGLELCDGSDLDGEQCQTLGFSGGTLGCNDNCYLWDVSQCTASSPVCGNNIAEGPEPCDGTDMGSAENFPCTLLGFTGGTLSCGTGCVFDTSTCTGGQAGWTCPQSYYDANDGCDCGCGVVDPDCVDATAGSCDYCDDVGSCNGSAACTDPNSIINASDNSSCDAASCGNNVAEGTEPCDGTDLRGNDCAALGMGYSGGTLACNGNCGLDTSGCTQPTCGDNTTEGLEWCDGSDLTIACEDIAYYDGGTMACDSSCNLDTTGCTTPVCGDNTATGGEYCDGTDLGPLDGVTCQQMGFSGGSWGCTDCGYDLSGCTGGTPGWTCPEAFYGDGDCDCGCGVIDVDCAGPSVYACDFCNNPGSCNPLGNVDCPATIDPDDNSQCQ